MRFALALGFPSADHFLAAISRSQWLEWRQFVEIEGPIGGPRNDFYTSYIAYYASRQTHAKDTTLSDFKMPWMKDETEDEDE